MIFLNIPEPELVCVCHVRGMNRWEERRRRRRRRRGLRPQFREVRKKRENRGERKGKQAPIFSLTLKRRKRTELLCFPSHLSPAASKQYGVCKQYSSPPPLFLLQQFPAKLDPESPVLPKNEEIATTTLSPLLQSHLLRTAKEKKSKSLLFSSLSISSKAGSWKWVGGRNPFSGEEREGR